MKIYFTEQQKDFSRYQLGNDNVTRVPKMTDEQVAAVNKTRKMPENYHVMTRETNYYSLKGDYKPTSYSLYSGIYKQPVINIIKGEKNFPKQDMPTFYDTLPAGFELENTIFGTFLKKTGVKYALINYLTPAIYVGCGAILGFLLNSLSKLKK